MKPRVKRPIGYGLLVVVSIAVLIYAALHSQVFQATPGSHISQQSLQARLAQLPVKKPAKGAQPQTTQQPKTKPVPAVSSQPSQSSQPPRLANTGPSQLLNLFIATSVLGYCGRIVILRRG